jgi:hypothetical protein
MLINKFIFPIVIASLLFLACKPKTDADATAKTTEEVAKDGISKAGDTITLPSLQDNNRPSLLGVLELVGQKPSSVQLFDKMDIGARMKKFMGSNYDSLIKNWNEDTPLEKDGDIVYTSGCKTANCAEYQYIIIFDTKIQIINVYTFEGKKMRTFEEDNTITGLPYKCQDWFDAIIQKHI